MPENRVIIYRGNGVIMDCDLNTYGEDLREVDNPRFEEAGSITLKLIKKFQIRQTSMILQDIYTIPSSVTISKELHLLCHQEFTEHCVNRMLHSLEVDPRVIDLLKTEIVLKAVNLALVSKIRGLKQFGLVADIEVRTIREAVQEREELDLIRMESIEQNLRRVLLQSMEERNLKRNPASKSSIEKLKRGHFEGGVGEELVLKNCAVCLDDFEIGSEVVFMPCSHMFHGGCLDRWLKESNSCPLCRLELTE